MNEKELKLYIAAIYIGVITAVILLIIDFKLKNDVVKMLGGDNGAGQDKPASNWNSVRTADSNIRPVPNSRFSPGVAAEADTSATQEAHPTDDELAELERRAYDSPVPEGD